MRRLAWRQVGDSYLAKEFAPPAPAAVLPSVNVSLQQSGTSSHQRGQISDQGENPDHGETARSEIRRGTNHQKQHDRQGGRHAEGNQNAQRPVHEGSPAEWTLRRSHKKKWPQTSPWPLLRNSLW